MPRSADPHIRLLNQPGTHQGAVDHDALARLARRLVELDLDTGTIELLLAALTADEVTTNEAALTIPLPDELRTR